MDSSNKYSVNNYDVSLVLSWYKCNEIAIPEIQRPFIWDSTKVRNLLDSLYQGYPIGYLIIWKDPNVKLKDGSSSEGKKILIDGQQRIMALITSILSEEVISKDYTKSRVAIAFQPLDEKFEVLNPAIQKDSAWIPDIGPIISGKTSLISSISDYLSKNKSVPQEKVEHSFESLKKIMTRPIGVIELGHDLEIETVTEIFIRINSAGVPLNQADFAMSKIASNEIYGGNQLRKSIDYFCHLAKAPEFFENIRKVDSEFVRTESFQKISWLKDEIDDLYDPSYSDLLRVAFTSQFNRGKLSDLVNLLSGRNFETREYEADIAKESFERLRQGVYNFSKEDNFKKFVMIIRSAGFTSKDLIRSISALNFAYVLFLKLKAQNVNPSNIERFVRKWFVMSILTERYSSSPESQFDYDIRNISTGDFREFFKEIEAGDLSDAFWETTMIQKLRTPVASSPYFNLFLAALIKLNHKGFLSRDITVNEMISLKGDIHHIFPREYLKANGYKREEYNQIANYAMTQQEINIKIGKKSPKDYLSTVLNQCNGATPTFGGIDDINTFRKNLEENCVPEETSNMEAKDYRLFLEKRRVLMSKKIREYYNSL